MPGAPEVDVDVLVVGAGPTGLALAALLAAGGVRPRVVDRLAERGRESRALAVQPRTLEVLAGLGVSDRLVDVGNPTVRLQLHAGGRTTELPLFDVGLEDTAYPFLLFVSQAETEAALLQSVTAHGVAVERGVELRRLEPDGDGVTCHLRDAAGRTEVVRAGWVVGCDGSHSVVRRDAGIRFSGASYPQSFVLADLEVDGLAPGVAHAHLSSRGPLLFFPLGRPASWRMIAMRPRGTVGFVGGPTLADLQRLADGVTGGGVRLHDPVWTTDFRLHHRAAERYRAGRVLVAGDAAHVHSPAGAQGMNTGIQDAVNLAWKLALVVRGRGAPALLDTYEPERAPVGRAVLRVTDRAFAVVTSSNPLLGAARDRAAPGVVDVVGRTHALRALAFRTVGELTIGYRRSPLSASRGGASSPTGGAPGAVPSAVPGALPSALPGALTQALPGRRTPRPGDRLPDAPVTVDGRASTLHRMVAEPVLHLLVWDPAGTFPASTGDAVTVRYPGLVRVHRVGPGAAPGVLHDPSGRLASRLSLTDDRPEHLLVRPDGHLALRGSGDLHPLRDHLERWLIATGDPATT